PHSTFSPEGVIAAPHVTSVAHALAVGVSRPPPMWWFAQRSFAPQLDEAGYAVVDGSARKRANSTAPFALRKPAPWLSASKPSWRVDVYSRIALTAFGMSAGFAWTINATVPLTTGAAALVPLMLKYGKYEVDTVPASRYGAYVE